jgi:hypothetical protein
MAAPNLKSSNPSTAATVRGQEFTCPIRYEIVAPERIKGSQHEVYRLWIPAQVKRVRAVIVVPDYATDRAIYFSDELGYRQFAERMDFALLAYRIFDEDADATRDAATMDMLSALEILGKRSGHPELAFACLIPIGLSWGGRCAAAIALSVPDRTLGFVPLHQTLTFKEIAGAQHKAAFFQVPGLCETAQLEEFHSHASPDLEGTDATPVVLACNAHGAIHAGFILPGGRHAAVEKPGFLMQWITVITELRIPSPLSFDQIPKLKALARESSWLGTYEYEHHWKPEGEFDHFEIKSVSIVPCAEYKGDPGTAHWLPNETMAKAWKAKMGF